MREPWAGGDLMTALSRAAERMRVVEGDITRLPVDAIVNAAYERLAPGGGVCGAIHRAAGPELAAACRAIGGCPTGEARLTTGFALPARFVIHAVGPVWHGGNAGEAALLAGCYRNALELAARHGIATVAFPAISTGVYGYPPEDAAPVAARAAAEVLAREPALLEVTFCCFGAASAALHRQAVEALATGSASRNGPAAARTPGDPDGAEIGHAG
jgi:O-acetyl-ADP-ribose deacetylase (regulator of RNase III)